MNTCVLYLNVRGLTTNINQLKVLVNRKKPAAIVLSETHITSDISDSEISIRGYNLVRCDSHSRHTGGVLIYVKKATRFKLDSSS